MNTSSDESSAEHPMDVVHFKTRKNATSVDYREKYSLNAESILIFRLLCTLIDTEFEFQIVLMALMMEWCSNLIVCIVEKRVLCSN